MRLLFVFPGASRFGNDINELSLYNFWSPLENNLYMTTLAAVPGSGSPIFSPLGSSGIGLAALLLMGAYVPSPIKSADSQGLRKLRCHAWQLRSSRYPNIFLASPGPFLFSPTPSDHSLEHICNARFYPTCNLERTIFLSHIYVPLVFLTFLF